MDAAHLSFADHALRYREPIAGRAAWRGDVLARYQGLGTMRCEDVGLALT